MAVQIIKFPKPYLEIELVADGSLTIGQEYFFSGYFERNGGYYGQASGPASDEVSITTTSGNQKIKITWWQDGGSISAFADAGNSNVTVTSSGHGRDDADSVVIKGTTNYDGTYTIASGTTDTYNVIHSWDGDDATGTWTYDNSLPTYAAGIAFKWDKYTMINSVDGEFYQWLNLNDPVNAAKGEFDETYGHRRWSVRYSADGHTGTFVTWIAEATTGYELDELHDGIAQGSTKYTSRSIAHPQLALQDTTTLFPLPSWMARDQGKLLIVLDDTSANDQDDIIDALEASGYTDMYTVSHSNNKARYNTRGCTIIALAEIYVESSVGNNVISDVNITLIGNGCIIGNVPTTTLAINRCTLTFVANATSFWVNGCGTVTDTIIDVCGNAFILDDYVASNFTPKGAMTFYRQSYSGYNMIGGYGGAPSTFQWRYMYDTKGLSDFYIKDLVIYMTANNATDTATFYFTDVEMVNEGLKDYDMEIDWSYKDLDVVDYIFECTNLTSDRTAGKIKLQNRTYGDPASIACIFNFRFDIDLTVLDENTDPIVGADIKIAYTGGSDTDTTDASGEGTVKGLSYTLEYDAGDADGYGYHTKTSAFLEQSLVISKAGYRTYKLNGFTMTEGVDWTIKLSNSPYQTTI